MTELNDISGFFVNPAGQQYDRIGQPELIYSSPNGLYDIYRADRSGQFRVYKALKEQYRGQALYEDLLHKEFQIGYTLRHPNICEYVSYLNLTRIGWCIEMEWIDGINLEELIKSDKADRYLYRKIICETCDALSYIHSRQVIHRDLKPSNIMVTHNGHNVKLIDFGFSDTDCHSILKQAAGTAIYAAPELLQGRDVDNKADIYSLGCIIDRISEGMHILPPSIARHCTQRNPAKRYRTALEVKTAVEHPHRRLAIVFLLLLALALIAVFVIRTLKLGNPAEALAMPETVSIGTPESGIPATDSIDADSADNDTLAIGILTVTESHSQEPAPHPAAENSKAEYTFANVPEDTDTVTEDTISIDELFRQATMLIEDAGM